MILLANFFILWKKNILFVLILEDLDHISKRTFLCCTKHEVKFFLKLTGSCVLWRPVKIRRVLGARVVRTSFRIAAWVSWLQLLFPVCITSPLSTVRIWKRETRDKAMKITFQMVFFFLLMCFHFLFFQISKHKRAVSAWLHSYFIDLGVAYCFCFGR